MSAPNSNPPRWTFTGIATVAAVLVVLATVGFACCRSEKVARLIKPASSSPNPVVRTEVRYEAGPVVADPVEVPDPTVAFPSENPQPPAPPTLPDQAPVPATVLMVTNTVTITNTVVQWRTNELRFTNTVILRQTNNRVETRYIANTNPPASTSSLQAGQVTVNLPPPSGGPLVASGGYLQVAGHDNFIGWHPGMNQSGQQLTPSGPIPGTAGHFQKVSIGQSFALNKGQIAVIDFPNGNNPPCKINATGGKARILYDGLTEEEMLQQSGSLHSARRMTVENTVDEVLLARTE